MNTEELKNIWQDYDTRLEKSLKLNAHCIESIQVQKVKSAFGSLQWFKVFEILISLAFVVFLVDFLYHNRDEWYYIASCGILMAFCIAALAGSIHQIVLIRNINYGDSILNHQKKLPFLQSAVLLQSALIKCLRLAFLSLPFYTAYIIIGFKVIFNLNIVAEGDRSWWIAQWGVSLLFIPISIWLYRKISYKNMHIGWVKKLIENAGGKSVSRAMEYIEELDAYEKENIQKS